MFAICGRVRVVSEALFFVPGEACSDLQSDGYETKFPLLVMLRSTCPLLCDIQVDLDASQHAESDFAMQCLSYFGYDERQR